MKIENTHLSIDDIALFIEGGYSQVDAARVDRHLKQCDRCRELVQDATVHASIFSADPDLFGAPSELVDLGEGPALTTASSADATRIARRPQRTGLFDRAGWRTAIATLAVVALAVGAWWYGTHPSQPQLSPELLAPVQTAIEVASARGPIVIPGGEDFEGVSQKAYRSGPAVSDDLRESIDFLLASYQEKPDREVAYWLVAALLSSGQVDAARDYARDARRTFPDDASIGILSALVSYTDGDLNRAEYVLRSVAEQDKGNIAARINLAVVLIDQGRLEEARAVFAETKRLSSSLSARLDELESAAGDS